MDSLHILILSIVQGLTEFLPISSSAHLVLLPQSAAFLKKHGITGKAAADSAGAAKKLARDLTPGEGVLASELAGSIHGLKVLARDIEDHGHNTTR